MDFSYLFFDIRKLYHLVSLSLCKMVMKTLQAGQDGRVGQVWDVPLPCHRIHRVLFLLPTRLIMAFPVSIRVLRQQQMLHLQEILDAPPRLVINFSIECPLWDPPASPIPCRLLECY